MGNNNNNNNRGEQRIPSSRRSKYESGMNTYDQGNQGLSVGELKGAMVFSHDA